MNVIAPSERDGREFLVFQERLKFSSGHSPVETFATRVAFNLFTAHFGYGPKHYFDIALHVVAQRVELKTRARYGFGLYPVGERKADRHQTSRAGRRVG